MSRIDPECFTTDAHDDDRVCSACVGDPDLNLFIRKVSAPRGCSYCMQRDAPTAPLTTVAEFIAERMGTFYGRAADQLPYESAEGDYIGWHVDTHDLLFDTIGLDLPRDGDRRLTQAIVDEIGDDTWCNHDWLCLDLDDSFRFNWHQFCRAVKQHRMLKRGQDKFFVEKRHASVDQIVGRAVLRVTDAPQPRLCRQGLHPPEQMHPARPLPHRLRGHEPSGDHAPRLRRAALRGDRDGMLGVQSVRSGLPVEECITLVPLTAGKHPRTGVRVGGHRTWLDHPNNPGAKPAERALEPAV